MVIWKAIEARTGRGLDATVVGLVSLLRVLLVTVCLGRMVSVGREQKEEVLALERRTERCFSELPRCCCCGVLVEEQEGVQSSLVLWSSAS